MWKKMIPAVLSGLVGCSGCEPAVPAIVECTLRNRDDITRLVDAAVRLLDKGGSWQEVEELAIAAGKDIGGCVLAEVIDAVASRPALTSGVDVAKGNEALRDFKRRVSGTSTVYRTAWGDH